MNYALQPGETVLWLNPDRADLLDGLFSAVSVSNSAQTTALYCRMPFITGIGPPPGSDIKAINLLVRNISADGLWFEGTNPVAGIRLVHGDGTIGTGELSQGARLPQTNENAYVYYGGLWGEAWSTSDVAGLFFGALFAVDGPIGSASTLGALDALQLEMQWCQPVPTPTP